MQKKDQNCYKRKTQQLFEGKLLKRIFLLCTLFSITTTATQLYINQCINVRRQGNLHIFFFLLASSAIDKLLCDKPNYTLFKFTQTFLRCCDIKYFDENTCLLQYFPCKAHGYFESCEMILLGRRNFP